MRREKNAAQANPQIASPDEAQQELPAPAEIIPAAPPPAAPAPQPPDPQPPASKPASSGAKGFWRVLTLLFWLGLFLGLIALLAAGLYFGWPIVYMRYILPVQNNTARVAELETQQQASQEQLAVMQTQLSPLATLQAGQALTLTALAPRLDTLESAINTHSQALAALESTQVSLMAGDQTRSIELERQVTLLKSMELLSRARLFLYESNFGLAKQDVQLARDLLAGLPQDAALAEVLQRLDLTLSRLPDFPVAASDDLDIAWQILLQGQPRTSATPTAVVEQYSPTPTAAVEQYSPTPTVLDETPAPTATP
jgi:hypothetical protein